MSSSSASDQCEVRNGWSRLAARHASASRAFAEPDTLPLVTAMFYRPGAGFAESFEATVKGMYDLRFLKRIVTVDEAFWAP